MKKILTICDSKKINILKYFNLQGNENIQMRYVLAAIINGFESSRHKKTFKKLCTGDGAGAVIPAGSKLGSGAGAEKAQNSWARLFASTCSDG